LAPDRFPYFNPQHHDSTGTFRVDNRAAPPRRSDIRSANGRKRVNIRVDSRLFADRSGFPKGASEAEMVTVWSRQERERHRADGALVLACEPARWTLCQVTERRPDSR
jgi:hypothetical protein